MPPSSNDIDATPIIRRVRLETMLLNKIQYSLFRAEVFSPAVIGDKYRHRTGPFSRFHAAEIEATRVRTCDFRARRSGAEVSVGIFIQTTRQADESRRQVDYRGTLGFLKLRNWNSVSDCDFARVFDPLSNVQAGNSSREGHRLRSRRRESSISRLLTSEAGLSGPLEYKKMREHAHYFRVSRIEPENRGPAGG